MSDSLGSLCHKPEAFEISRMFVNTVEPVLNGHPRGMAKRPLNRG